MYRTILVALIALMIASPADAKLFGRKSRNTSGGGYQSFPANTPPANCVGGQCQMQLAPQAQAQAKVQVVPRAATVSPPEVSIVVQRTTSLETAEARLAKAEALVAEARAAVVQARLEAQRQATREAIELDAKIRLMEFEHQQAIQP